MILESMFMQPEKDYLSAKEATELLGIKMQTLYAYVSRGMVRSFSGKGTRAKLYSREDVQRIRLRTMAQAGQVAVAASAMNLGPPIVPTSITEITPQGPSYRGQLATDLALKGATFEQVAELLWTGLWHETDLLWKASPITPRDKALLRSIPAEDARHQLIEILSLVAMQLAIGRGPLKDRLRSGRPLDAARGVVHGLIGCFGFLGEGGRYEEAKGGRSVSHSLLVAMSKPVSQEDRRLLDAILVLLADHELSPGTFAARIAASAGTSVHSCIAAAIAASSGTEIAERYEWLDEFQKSAKSTPALISKARKTLSSGQQLPGFNHPLYPAGDPRATVLMDLVRQRSSRPTPVKHVLALVDHLRMEYDMQPRHELAVVLACKSMGLPDGAPSALFVLARTAGWVAHILEQRLSNTMLRPRAKYSSKI
ncbi:citrate synthase [Hydrogenophaga sp. PBL-H3]|nr:citrate synthase [Hydrogenophaga sp. PBL-H3]QHE79967.1 citrate synthase [Hydrogenophaga sp. PBL-H3]